MFIDAIKSLRKTSTFVFHDDLLCSLIAIDLTQMHLTHSGDKASCSSATLDKKVESVDLRQPNE